MSDPNKPTPILSSSASSVANDSQAAETQMRRALGLQGSSRPVHQQRPDQARARHRFVQDGGVPVVMLNRGDADPLGPLKSRVAELENQLEAERAAHAQTKRTLHEAQIASQALQTRLAHAEFARHDTLQAEQKARESAEAALQEANAAKQAAAELKAAVKQARRSTSAAQRATTDSEPQPVKWWLPNYKVHD